MLNFLDEGRCLRKTMASPTCQHWDGRTAWVRLHHIALREASRLERVRRSIRWTGVATLATLLKSPALDDSEVRENTKSQIPMIASSIDEPTYPNYVELLQVFNREKNISTVAKATSCTLRASSWSWPRSSGSASASSAAWWRSTSCISIETCRHGCGTGPRQSQSHSRFLGGSQERSRKAAASSYVVRSQLPGERLPPQSARGHALQIGSGF